MQYRPFRVDSAKRLKVTYLLISLFLLQLLFVLACKRMQASYLHLLTRLNLIAWIAGGIWLGAFYF